MASRSLNRVILLGNLTRDPELKYTPSGTPVCTFGVATNRNWTTSDGQQKEEVQYHKIIAWQKLAELCGKILTKGKKVYLEGRLTYRNYTTKDGQQRSVAEIVLDDFIVFNSNKKSSEETIKTNNQNNNKKAENEKEIEEDVPIDDSTNSEEIKIEEDIQANEESDKTKEEKINPDDIPF
ncbi:MAG: single-stranded DNA-binding protein [Patescibacteria group bacterium]|nr:single-stranded DNA-binding protein [Patescibacteria group bacterium]